MENQTAPAENQNGPMLSVQSVYLKDCSYEAPKGPRVEGNWSPQISLDINTTASVVAPELHEVVITVTVGAKQGVYFAALALLEPGDETIVIDPCWVNYAPSIELAGGRAVPVAGP